MLFQMKALLATQSFISITFDGWTSRALEGFQCVTGQNSLPLDVVLQSVLFQDTGLLHPGSCARER